MKKNHILIIFNLCFAFGSLHAQHPQPQQQLSMWERFKSYLPSPPTWLRLPTQQDLPTWAQNLVSSFSVRQQQALFNALLASGAAGTFALLCNQAGYPVSLGEAALGMGALGSIAGISTLIGPQPKAPPAKPTQQPQPGSTIPTITDGELSVAPIKEKTLNLREKEFARSQAEQVERLTNLLRQVKDKSPQITQKINEQVALIIKQNPTSNETEIVKLVSESEPFQELIALIVPLYAQYTPDMLEKIHAEVEQKTAAGQPITAQIGEIGRLYRQRRSHHLEILDYMYKLLRQIYTEVEKQQQTGS